LYGGGAEGVEPVSTNYLPRMKDAGSFEAFDCVSWNANTRQISFDRKQFE
jgi:hypothetical protein